METISVISNSGLSNEGLSTEESNQLLQVHRDILEVLVTDNDFQFALDSLCRSAEGILPGALASIMVFNDERTSLSVRSAPNIPEAAIQQLENLIPGEGFGSCAAAVYNGVPQYVYDTLGDSLWENVRDFATTYNINACWSIPILGKANQVVGSFALSSFEKSLPNNFHENLLQTAAYLSGLVLLREKEERIIQRAAYSDQLTGLANRLQLNKKLEQAISKSVVAKSELAILFIDLDNFKIINDELGHETGDTVLSNIANMMQACINPGDTLARLGGDEFVLLVESFEQKKDLKKLAQKVLSVFDKPIVINKKEFDVSASVGISLYPEHSVKGKELIKLADQAMYIAKRKGQGQIQFYCKDEK